MPSKKLSVPSYRLHKPSGRARVIVGGKHVYLGEYDSPESRLKCSKLIAELSQPTDVLRFTQPHGTSLPVAQVVVGYLQFAEQEYPPVQGKPNKELIAIKAPLKPLVELYKDISTDEFGPKKLKIVRQKLLEAGLCRNEFNKRMAR